MKKNLHFPLLTLLLVVAFCMATPATFAQIKFTAHVSYNTVARDQALQLEFVVEGAEGADDFTAPSFTGFNILQGPAYGSYFSVNNGEVTKGINITYILMPQKPGKLVIDAAQVKVKGKIYRSNPVTITVLNQLSGSSNNNAIVTVPPLPGFRSNSSNNPDNKEFILRKGEDPIAKIQKNLFVQVEVNKQTCYEGEPIVATYKLYTRLRSVSRVTKRPSFNGFSVVEMTQPENMDFRPDQLNGKPIYSTIIRKVQLFPLQSGQLILEPVEIASQVRFLKAGEKPKTNNNVDDLFNDFFDDEMLNGETEEHNLTQESKPVTITVKPLPEAGKPVNFNGAVGKFTIQTALNNNDIAANENGTLKVVVEGKGNLSMINTPAINWPNGMEGFEATARENIDNATSPTSGTKAFEYPFTVNEKGKYEIPAVSLSYFNPETEKYETANSAVLDFAVNRVAEKKTPLVAVKDYPQEEEEIFIDKAKNFYDDTLKGEWWWPAIALVLLIWGGYQWRQKIKLSRAKNELKRIIEEENKEADAEAVPLTEGLITTFNTDPLDKARQQLKNNNAIGFYNELHAAVWSFLQQKYQLSPMDMNKRSVSDKLRADLFGENIVADFVQILNTCELALYTPDHSQEEMYQLLQRAETFIKTIEYKIV
ncbi:MAG: BatD family protein [Sphingobacteriales bacterium]|nr:BatD family protein [Sphingobacteriales bacterium]